MNKLLYITANPRGVDRSFGLQVGEHFLEAASKENPDLQVERVDVYEEHIPLIDADVLNGWDKLRAGEALNETEAAALNRMNEVLEQFLSADGYVFVTPMWNLSYPPMLKAYIDNIAIAGKTFRYTANGPEGLMTGKKVVHIQARGGIYSEGPAADFEFTDKYLRGIMAFIGITDYEHVYVEGIAAYPDKAEELVQGAKTRAAEAAVQFAKTPSRV
ncbi:FMN-dependent NADH-azoreductase [Paenibacillus chitinolyticus]|uniref:FMN-dependent NADH-azoreductase n=1 Tax=Paenibacillus chitinolyticus TaxID=79263 RepID=UPI002DB6890D|nr:FMN-dependent NADH-azoreductase [Paenibacillus chitinolyticus]MEC0248987.1 FMN-dependent NADH-azoreductase [Paenibacillus chitinolyticus]